MRTAVLDLEKSALKADIPTFAVGDSVRVDVEIVEGDKTRLQAFEGVVIARKGSGSRENLHRSSHCLGRGGGTYLSPAFPPGREDYVGPARQGTARQALLPASQGGQEGPRERGPHA